MKGATAPDATVMMRDRRCRWCPFTTPRTFRGAAALWRHVRAEHAALDWDRGTTTKKAS